MVNNKNLYLNYNSKLTEPPAVNDGDTSDRFIQAYPIWNLNELINIALKNCGNNIKIVTDKATKNYEALLEDGFDLLSTLKAISNNGKFKEAVWCKTSPRKDRNGKPRGLGSWIPCDAYSVNCEFEHPVTGYKGVVNYYIKMCKGLDGNTVLFVSIHV